MNRSCFFYQDKALFGSYPTQENINILESIGVRWFIDLTTQKDNLIEYKTKYNKIKYPIIDHNIPKDWYSFTKLLYKIKIILDNLKYINEIEGNEKIYLHCRGGHGRSGTVAACILSFYLKIDSKESLEIINKCHKTRKDMSEKSRSLNVPNKIKQISFVHKFFSPLVFYSNSNDSRFLLSMYSKHSIYVDNMYFSNCNDAIFYYTKFNNDNMSNFEIIEKIILLKLKQHEEVYIFLSKTGMRPIIDLYTKNRYNRLNNLGNLKNISNIIGEVYMKIRNDIYKKFTLI